MKLLVLLSLLCIAVHATVTSEDVTTMINRLQSAIDNLGNVKVSLEASTDALLADLKQHSQEDNSNGAGLACFQKLAAQFVDNVNLMVDESLLGYTRSSQTLIDDLVNNVYEPEELEHTKHMLSNEGSYFMQMRNSVQYTVDSIQREMKGLDKAVHEQCCKH